MCRKPDRCGAAHVATDVVDRGVKDRTVEVVFSPTPERTCSDVAATTCHDHGTTQPPSDANEMLASSHAQSSSGDADMLASSRAQLSRDIEKR